MPDVLRSHNVLLVSDSTKGAEFFEKILSAQRISSVTTASSAGEARRDMIATPFDVLIINSPLKDEQGIDLALDASASSSAGIVVFVKNDSYEQIAYEAERYGVLVVPKPISAQDALRAVRLAGAVRERLRTLETKNVKLSEKMDEIRIVNRAKWALIANLRMEEPQAHRYIEKHAMDMRISKRDAAESIIKTYEKC